jgi:hypothetical protein
MNTIYRQGDVMLRRVDALPAQAAALPPTEPTRVILAYGEVTGHAHAIDPAEAVEYTVQDAANVVRRFLSVTGTKSYTVPITESVYTGLDAEGEPVYSHTVVGHEEVKGAQVKHEEHAPVILPAGLYEVIQQVDYSPGAIRAVAD